MYDVARVQTQTYRHKIFSHCTAVLALLLCSDQNPHTSSDQRIASALHLHQSSQASTQTIRHQRKGQVPLVRALGQDVLCHAAHEEFRFEELAKPAEIKDARSNGREQTTARQVMARSRRAGEQASRRAGEQASRLHAAYWTVSTLLNSVLT